VRDLATGKTTRVDVSSDGQQANDSSGYDVAINGDGRFAAFTSYASNLVPGDTNNSSDVFVRDRVRGTTTRVSVGVDGVEGDEISFGPAISRDGRYVAFHSDASNLVSESTPPGVYLRDRLARTTTLVSASYGSTPANGFSFDPSVSDNGRYIAFESAASNLVRGDTNGDPTWPTGEDIFVRDVVDGTTKRVSVSSGEVQSNGESNAPKISGDGRYVVFWSNASNLVSGDHNGAYDVFVRDLRRGTTRRIPAPSTLEEGGSGELGISDNGRYVVFSSDAVGLVASDQQANLDVFQWDRLSGVTTLVSESPQGTLSNGYSSWPSISATGRYISFISDATNLVLPDANGGDADVYVRDRGW
jgi:Tol biopolymer transport system component